MDDINMIANEEQIAADLPVEETKVKKKLSKGKIILISVASFVGVLLLLVWCVIGCPVPGSMASCEQHVGKSYSHPYGDVADGYSEPRLALTEDGRICQGYFKGYGYKSYKPTARIVLNPLNFDLLLPERIKNATLSNGAKFATTMREQYSSAWLYIDTENDDFNVTVYIANGNGFTILYGSIFPWLQNGKWGFTSIIFSSYLGDIQQFYDYVGG